MTALLLTTTVIVLAAVLLSLRYAWWRSSADYRLPRILMYHMVRSPRPNARFNKLRVAPAAFERQLKWLVAHGWQFAFLSELADLKTRNAATKTVVLTFDDGYRDNFLAAHPLLLKYNAKATLFLVADRHDRDWSSAKKKHHDSGELQREPKLDDDDVRAMLDSGAWELGAHTLTHALLPKLDAASRRAEIAGGKEALEHCFRVRIESFAYPFGIYEDQDVALAAATGYRYAVTTEPGISGDLHAQALHLKRIKVSGKDGLFAFSLRLRTGWRGLAS